jgi:hypothetical protein
MGHLCCLAEESVEVKTAHFYEKTIREFRGFGYFLPEVVVFTLN